MAPTQKTAIQDIVTNNLRIIIDRINAEKPAWQVDIKSFTCLGKQASGRVYWKFSASLPAVGSLVLMQIPEELSGEITGAPKKPNDASSPMSSMQANFCAIATYFDENNIPVPQIHLKHTKPAFLVIDDLGQTTLEAYANQASQAEIYAIYEKAVHLLVRMQRQLFPLKPSTPDSAKNLICYNREFNAALLRAELDHFTEWLVQVGLDHALSSKETSLLSTCFDNIVSDISAIPRTLIHRDYQSRNIMLRDQKSASGRNEHELVLIDFQDAMIGPCVYDLVALLQDSYVDLGGESIRKLMQSFYDHTNHFDSYESFEIAFWTQVAQRKLKDAGRFVYLERKRGDASFLAHIPRSITCVQTALRFLSPKISWAKTLNKQLGLIFDRAIIQYSD